MFESGSMRSVLAAVIACIAIGAAGCAAPATPPPQAPTQPAPAASPPVVAATPEGRPSPLPPADSGLPGAPPECAAYVARPLGVCGAPFLPALDEALSAPSPEERDAKLALLESCPEAGRGWVRALRADLGPTVCADRLVENFYANSPPPPTVEVESLLVGLALAARLRRLDSGPPPAPIPNTRATFLAFFEEQLEPWVTERAAAIFRLSRHGAKLQGYGRGVVAVEAAFADLRFVEMAREVPLPDEMKADPAVSHEYYAALDVALEPRKLRGRDAALAGLDAFADLGVITSPRVDRAREILSRSYAGHRIDALDRLRFPALPEASQATVETRLARRLPTFFSQHALASSNVTDPALLRVLLEAGLPPAARQKLDASPLTFEVAELYARGLVALGQRYWRSGDFKRAAAVAAIVPAPGQTVSDHARLLAALSRALESGPKDAREMMVGGPLLPLGFGNVAALDELAKRPGEVGAMAAYDAAYVLSFLPPTERVKEFWTGIAERYERAAKLTKDPAFRDDATARAKAARETARAVRQ